MTEINRYKKNQRMSQIVVHNGLVYLAGQVASTAPGESIETQTKNVLDKIDTYLNEVGSHKGNILSANIWLSSIKDFDSMNKIWDEWVDSENPPVRACVESKLASEKFIVEISIIAKL